MSLFHVTLIDTKGQKREKKPAHKKLKSIIDSFEYTPRIVAKLVNPEKVSSLRFTHKSYVRNGKVIIGYAKDICEDATCVVVNGEKVNSLTYDYR